jgi:hypothetical protein
MAQNQDARDINSTVRVEGEPDTFKVNEGLRKISQWWSQLKAVVGSWKDGGGVFVGNIEANEGNPSYHFQERENTGLYIDPAYGEVHYARVGKDYGALVGSNYSVRLVKNSNTTISINTWTVISWNAIEDIDRGGMWDSGDPTKIQIPVSGLYLVMGTAMLTPIAGPPAETRLAIDKNGSRVASFRELRAQIHHYSRMTTANIIWADAQDYFRLQIYHNSTSNETLNGALVPATFMARRIG